MMSHPFFACLLAVSCAGLSAAPLRVGGFIVAPFVMGEPNQPLRGALRAFIERDVVTKGVPLTWMPPTSLKRALDDLRDGSIDVLLLASGPLIREPGTVPFDWTYLLTQPNLAVREDSTLWRVEALDRLSGMKIGWVVGPTLSPGLVRSGARWQRTNAVDWQEVNLRKLQAGMLDAVYFENEYSPRYWAGTANIPIRLVLLPMPRRAFFMIRSLKADPAAIAHFDRAARAAFAGRRFHEFLRTYAEHSDLEKKAVTAPDSGRQP